MFKKSFVLMIVILPMSIAGCVADEALLVLEDTQIRLDVISRQLEEVKQNGESLNEDTKKTLTKTEKIVADAKLIIDATRPVLEAETAAGRAIAIGEGAQSIAPLLPPGWAQILGAVGALVVGVAGGVKHGQGKIDSYNKGKKDSTPGTPGSGGGTTSGSGGGGVGDG